MVSNASHRTTKRATNPGTAAKLLICFISFFEFFPDRSQQATVSLIHQGRKRDTCWCAPAPTITRLSRSASNISSCVLGRGRRGDSQQDCGIYYSAQLPAPLKNTSFHGGDCGA